MPLFLSIVSDHVIESDYRIFVWRQKSTSPHDESFPVLHVRNPDDTLPAPPEYQNPSFYIFKAHSSPSTSSARTRSRTERHSVKSSDSANTPKVNDTSDGVPKHKKEFEKFQNENGVRTVMGSIGPVNNGMFQLRIKFVIVFTMVYSTNAAQKRIPIRLHFTEVCVATRFYPFRRLSRALRLRRSCKVCLFCPSLKLPG